MVTTMNAKPGRVTFGTSGAGVEAICAIARGGASVTIAADALAGIEASYACLVRHAEQGDAIYGVSTGLGAAIDTRLDPVRGSAQYRIPRARAVGVGPFADTDEVRAMIAARLARFCLGYSGVSTEAAQALANLLNHAVHPKVPMTGSIGEADLAPLAHIALVLTGEGRVVLADGREVSGA